MLGHIQNEGNEMAQAVLTSKGTVIPRRSLRKLLVSGLHSETEKHKCQLFEDVIRKKLGDAMAIPYKPLPSDFVPYPDESESTSLQLPEDNNTVNQDGTSVFEKPITDCWIHAEVNLPQGENIQSAKVIGRSKDMDGNIVGTYDNNSRLNTMLYNVEFPVGEIQEYSVNVVA